MNGATSATLTDKVASLIPRMMPAMTADAGVFSRCYLISSGDYYCERCCSIFGESCYTKSCYTFYY
jgi:hypothetical protein